MIFLSKQGKDQYINMLAQGCGVPATNTEDFDFATSDQPVVLRGILNKVIKQCMQSGRKFYYMDSGYFGNNVGPKNPHGYKLWHRIVPNNLQHNTIVHRPRDRWERLAIDMHPRRHGRQIVIAVPDEKPCKFYNIDQQHWLTTTVATLKKITDRPITIRQRSPRREDRVHQDPLTKVLADDVHALVTFNSVAATEAVILGVPAFVLAPCNAAAPVANASLDSIDNPFWPDEDLRQAWACHLAYGQCHVKELQSGQAKHIMAEQHGQ